MSDKHPVRNNVVGTLIAAAIVSLITTFVPGGWQFVGMMFIPPLKTLSHWLSSEHLVTGWALALLISSGIAVLVVLAVLAWAMLVQSNNAANEWTNYLQDDFEGLRWRWRYVGTNVSAISCFCPHCDQQVYAENRGSYSYINRIGFRCDHCGRDLGQFDSTSEALWDKVARSVQRKIRNQEWPGRNRAP